jgi:hypothetical protein
MGQIVRDQYPPTPIRGEKTQRSISTPDQLPLPVSEGYLSSFECHSCLVMNYIANARHAHNPKVEGSNPPPQPILSRGYKLPAANPRPLLDHNSDGGRIRDLCRGVVGRLQ